MSIIAISCSVPCNKSTSTDGSNPLRSRLRRSLRTCVLRFSADIFYVYKYSTGISAALALAKRVTNGGEKEKEDYFKFLKSGGSRYPLESLKIAGVDMSSTKPVQDALDTFAQIVDDLKKL